MTGKPQPAFALDVETCTYLGIKDSQDLFFCSGYSFSHPSNFYVWIWKKNTAHCQENRMWRMETDIQDTSGQQIKQVRLVSAKAERPNHPSCGVGGSASQGGGVGGPPHQWQRRCRHDSKRPIRLTVALDLKTFYWHLSPNTMRERHHHGPTGIFFTVW